MYLKKRCIIAKTNHFAFKKPHTGVGFFGSLFANNFLKTLLFLSLCFFLNCKYTDVYAGNTISLTVNNPTISLDLMANSASGSFAESTASTILVSTDNNSGYKLALGSSDGETSLVNSSDETKAIDSISSSLDANTFSSSTEYNNKWGYKPSHIYNTSTEQTVLNTYFRSLPDENGELIAKTSSANPAETNDTYSLSFGAKIDNTLPAGQYSNSTFNVYAVVNVIEDPYMQTFTNGECGELTLNEITQLKDSRDETNYGVARLADGLCWMTSDLTIGSTTETITLTSEDTDITSDFTLPIAETSSTKTQWGTSNSTEGLDATHIYQYSSTKKLYNYYTATGGTTYSENTPTTSICPLGWKLPTRTQTNAYVTAMGETDGTTNTSIVRNAPLSLTQGYYNSTTTTAYSNRYYWVANGWQNSSTGVYYGYYFGERYSSSTYYVQTSYGIQKMMGAGIRCVKAASFTINLNANGGQVDTQSVSGTASEILSNLPTPTRSGFTFVGWYTQTSNGEEISSNTINTGTTTYYAIWYPDMQHFTDADCGDLAIGQNISITDARDGKKYNIARLGDGLCWMTKDLTIGSTTETMTLTSADTDITGSFTLPIAETSSTKTQWGTEGSTTGLDVAHIYQYSSTKKLYNYYTATGGTTYTENAPTTSICPLGWKLPTRAQANSYLSVVGEKSGTTNMSIIESPPLSFTSRYYDSTEMTIYGNKYIWLANGWRNSSTGVYYGYVFGENYDGTSYVETSYGNEKMMGISIRCVHTSNKEAGFTITLDPNGGTVGTNTLSGRADQILSNLPTPTREGYAFTGWYTAASGGEKISNINIAQGTPTYYAQWEVAVSIDTATYLQEVNSCLSTVETGRVYNLIDSRDGTTYNVAKLADGKCWTLENLSLDLTDSTVQSNLSSATTNASDTSLDYLKGTRVRDPATDPNGKYATRAVTKEWDSTTSSTDNVYADPAIAIDSTYGLCGGDYCINNDGTWSKDDITPVTVNGITSIAQGRIGVYYNYCAATAGSYCYGHGWDYGNSSGNATEDICPVHWRLPTGGLSSGEYRSLYTAYSSNNTLFQTALQTALTGEYLGYAEKQGKESVYWTSTRDDNDFMYVFSVESNGLGSLGASSRMSGYSIRCVIH